MQKIKKFFTPQKFKSWHKMGRVLNSLLEKFLCSIQKYLGFCHNNLPFIYFILFIKITQSPLYLFFFLILIQKLGLVQSLLSYCIAP